VNILGIYGGVENSLRMFYVALTSLLGFQVGEDKYKLMGLAAYGTKGVDLSEFLHPVLCGYQCDSSFLPEDYRQRTMFEPFYSEKLIALAGAPRRPEGPLYSPQATPGSPRTAFGNDQGGNRVRGRNPPERPPLRSPRTKVFSPRERYTKIIS
jgi:hypothetical protein